MFRRIFALLKVAKLKNRLRLYFTCFLVMLILLTTLPIILIGKQQRIKDTQDQLDKIMNVQQVFIDDWFEENLADIRSIVQLPTIKNKDLENMQVIFQEFKQNYSKFGSIVYANADGMTEVSDSGFKKTDLTERQYFHEAKKGNTYISEVLIGMKTKEPIIIVSAPVYDYEENFQGLIFGSIHLETIQNIMMQFQDETSETYLIDRNGELITESRQGEIGEKINSQIYQSAIGKEENKGFYQTSNRDLVFGDYRWVNEGKWLIIGEKKESEIFRPFYKLITVFFIEFLFLIIVGYVIILWFSSHIERPIYSVLKGTRRIGRGDWGYRLDSSKWTIDEFKELSDNFNEMANLLENHILSIAKSEQRFRMIAEHSSDVISVHDSLGKFLYISPAAKEILNYKADEVFGKYVFDFVHQDDMDQIRGSFKRLLTKGYCVVTYRVQHQNGKYLWFESSLRRLQIEDNEEKVYVVSRNITKRKKSEEELKERNKVLHDLFVKDGLTDVWNRRSFDERLKVIWHQGMIEHSSLALIFFDVDYFKNIMIHTVIWQVMNA